MQLAKRLVFYLGGFAIGIVLLFFFVGGSGASCEYDYGPNARVLKNIRNKERIIEPKALENLKRNNLDTAAVSTLLRSGKVRFSQSNTKPDSCKIYVIEKKEADKTLEITVANCQKEARITNIKIN